MSNPSTTCLLPFFTSSHRTQCLCNDEHCKCSCVRNRRQGGREVMAHTHPFICKHEEVGGLVPPIAVRKERTRDCACYSRKPIPYHLGHSDALRGNMEVNSDVFRARKWISTGLQSHHQHHHRGMYAGYVLDAFVDECFPSIGSHDDQCILFCMAYLMKRKP